MANTYLNAVMLAFIVFFIFFFGFFIGKIGFENGERVTGNFMLGEGNKVNTRVVAVDAVNKGVVANLETEIREGSGLVLVNINNILADVNTQYSARTSVQVAKEYADVDMGDKDIIFNIVTNASVVGGQSAGGAMTLSVLSLLLGKEINENVIITGSITENGTIGEATAIYEKAKAAKDNGVELLLVPEGVGDSVSNYKKVRRCGELFNNDFCETNFEEVTVNIGEDLGIEVIEVRDVGEAVSYYFV